MRKTVFNIIFITLLLFLSSCEDNLNSPVVNPEITANKKVLLEVFTSITCINCLQANIFCDNISFLNNVTINDTNVLIINYHPSFFPADPFFRFNEELNIEREQFYNIGFIPSGFSGGGQLASPFSASQWTNQINSNLAEFKEAAIEIENSTDTSDRTGVIVIRTELREQNQGGNLKLFIIVTENNLYYNAPIGNKNYHNIARQMINQPGGDPIQILPGQTTTLSKNYSINSGIEIKNSAIIVFVQNPDNRKVIAAENIKMIHAH